MTDYCEPHSLAEACELVSRYGEDGKVLSGGTALVLFMRQGLLTPGCLINIQRLPELKGITDGAALALGSLNTHADLARSAVIRSEYAALADTFARVATPRIRNMGTLGGNLANGDPHLDPPVTLLALNAVIEAQSLRGHREIPITSFFRGYYETALENDEILTQVVIPPREPGSGLAFIKYLPRSQDDYATVDVAVWIRLKDGLLQGASSQPSTVAEVRIALGSVASVPLRAVESETLISGQTLSDGLLREAGELAAAATDPEDDVRGSAAYKRELVKVLVRRAAQQALQDALKASGPTG